MSKRNELPGEEPEMGPLTELEINAHLEDNMDNFGTSVVDFSVLIETISRYYTIDEDALDGDDWQEQTGYKTPKKSVPKKIDKLVEQAFEAQLKKFIG